MLCLTPIALFVATVVSQVTLYFSELEKLFSRIGKDPLVLYGTFYIKFFWTKMLAKETLFLSLHFKMRVSLYGRTKISLLIIYAVTIFNLASDCHCLRRE